ncbi:hypothetical protein [Leifsonia sp. Root112D2]|nr:hypothetical protein [Leifsonia sp. Root112D2]
MTLESGEPFVDPYVYPGATVLRNIPGDTARRARAELRGKPSA